MIYLSLQIVQKMKPLYSILPIIVGLNLLIIGCEEPNSFEPYESRKIILYAPEPPGGIPGALINVVGLRFSPVPGENDVTIGGLQAEVLSAKENSLLVRIPSNADFAETELIVSRYEMEPDTAGIIVSDTPLAQVNRILTTTGPPGAMVTIVGKGFNPNMGTYIVYYEDLSEGFFVPVTEDNKYINTLLSASSDSLRLEIPKKFQEGRVRLNLETLGRPSNARYTIFTPEFTITH